jgi:hypothetical protein
MCPERREMIQVLVTTMNLNGVKVEIQLKAQDVEATAGMNAMRKTIVRLAITLVIAVPHVQKETHPTTLNLLSPTNLILSPYAPIRLDTPSVTI